MTANTPISQPNTPGEKPKQSTDREGNGYFKPGHAIRKMRTLAKARRTAEAEALGRAIGEQKAESKKTFQERLEEKIWNALDRLDPLESIAVIAGTILIYNAITTIEALHDKLIHNLSQNLKSGGLFGLVIRVIEGKQKDSTQTTPFDLSTIEGELGTWLIAFLAAFLMVRSAQKITAASVLPTIESIFGMLGFV